MSTSFHPNENYLIVSWDELAMALALLATPEKQAFLEDTLASLRKQSARQEPKRTILSVIAATAWLTTDTEDNGARSSVG